MLDDDHDDRHIFSLLLKSPHSLDLIDTVLGYLSISEQKILLLALNRNSLGKKLREVLSIKKNVLSSFIIPIGWNHWNIWCPSNKFNSGWRDGNKLDKYRIDVWTSNTLTSSEKSEIWHSAHYSQKNYLFCNLPAQFKKELLINVSTNISDFKLFESIHHDKFNEITSLDSTLINLWQFCDYDQKKTILMKKYKGDWIKKVIQGDYNNKIPSLLLDSPIFPWVEFKTWQFLDDQGKIDYFSNNMKSSCSSEFKPFLNSLLRNPRVRRTISSSSCNVFFFRTIDKHILDILDDNDKKSYFLMRSKCSEEVKFKKDILDEKYGYKSAQMVAKIIHNGSVEFIEKTWPYISPEGKYEWIKMDSSIPKNSYDFLKRAILGVISSKIQGIVNSLVVVNPVTLLLSIWDSLPIDNKEECVLSFISSPIQRDYLKELLLNEKVRENLKTLEWSSLLASSKSNYHVGQPIYLYDIFVHIKDILGDDEREWFQNRYSYQNSFYIEA